MWPCLYRKSNPDLLMVQTSEVRVGHEMRHRRSLIKSGSTTDPFTFVRTLPRRVALSWS